MKPYIFFFPVIKCNEGYLDGFGRKEAVTGHEQITETVIL